MWLMGPFSLLQLGHARLFDLFAQIGRIPLRDGGDDVLQEMADGIVVEGLRDRDQFDTLLLQNGLDGGIIDQVSGQPVDFVHDHRIDVLVFLAVGNQPLQLGPVGGLGGLSLINEVTHHLPAITLGIVSHRLDLGGDGEVLLGLFVRGDTGIEEAVHKRASIEKP